ncbi:helix-turn-helix transcriptional regulator [Caenimonas sedimenti]|uniref:Helix-turn-helix transcriptional regulator n=1 Tax=Caenimonas sedimenti TaxID=2596921 RepID=A0A562ZL94_9BURK|nr:helix-turn-helix transcriptional regulator [Caenimonas sedimenti]TWO69105.1 helix-turn-helix transcriptional regulator [Caenimonas sedimenti]
MPRSASNPSHALSREAQKERDQVLRTFGAGVRALRTERELSIEELAYRSSLSPSYVGGIERGVRNLSLFNVWRLAVGLHVPSEELMRPLDPTTLPRRKA